MSLLFSPRPKPDSRVVSLEKKRRSHGAFRVLTMVDPGRGLPRKAFVGRMPNGTARLPRFLAGVELVCMGAVLGAAVSGGFNPVSGRAGEIVPDVLAPGDLIVLKPGAGGVRETVAAALRVLPGANNKIEQRQPHDTCSTTS